jgi:hypothetical protein
MGAMGTHRRSIQEYGNGCTAVRRETRRYVRKLAEEIKEQFGVEVDPGHINYLLRKRSLTAPTRVTD